MNCLICDSLIHDDYSLYGGQPCHKKCIDNIHEEMDRELVKDLARCYGLCKITRWLAEYIIERQTKLH